MCRILIEHNCLIRILKLEREASDRLEELSVHAEDTTAGTRRKPVMRVGIVRRICTVKDENRDKEIPFSARKCIRNEELSIRIVIFLIIRNKRIRCIVKNLGM